MSKRTKRVLGVLIAASAVAACLWFFWGWWPVAYTYTIRVVTEG